MGTIDTIEGLIGGDLWFHFDVGNDVLYLRIRSKLDGDAIGEETPEGLVLLRDPVTDEPVGLTVVNWWSRFGLGSLPDSLQAIQKQIEPWAQKIAA